MNQLTTHAEEVRDSYVLIHIGDHRFAVAANLVAEMSPPVRLHRFPHATNLVSGVIVRRGKIVAVCNASGVVGSRKSSANLFYLITDASVAASGESLAIPVNGESELVSGEIQPHQDSTPKHISGTLLAGEDSIDVLDLRALSDALEAAANSPQAEARS